MYGMVNRSIQQYVRIWYGDDVWQQVLAGSGLPYDTFVSMQQYPDEDSVALVLATAEVVAKPVEAVLEEVGLNWISVALESDYGDLLRAAGDTLPEVLMSLDDLHTRVAQGFPELQPPSFWCTDLEEGSLVLHYVSVREGLAPMVKGLVHGLARMTGTTCTVEQIASSSAGADHDMFRVYYTVPEAQGAAGSASVSVAA